VADQLDFEGIPAPEVKRQRATWVTPFLDALQRHRNRSESVGRLLKELRRIKQENPGHEYDGEIWVRFNRFLRRTSPRYASPAHFRHLYPVLTPEGEHRRAVEDRLDAEHARRLRDNLAAQRAPTDPAAICDLVADLERRGRPAPRWLKEAQRRAEPR
jgi:hypothetical protein